MTTRRQRRFTPAALQLCLADVQLAEVAEEMKVHQSYVSRCLGGHDPYPDRLHGTLIEMVGIQTAVTIRALATQDRKERLRA